MKQIAAYREKNYNRSVYKQTAFTYHSYPKKLSSISDVLSAMDALQEELPGTDMHNLRAFNWTYRIITDAVIKKLGTGYFENDGRMQTIDIRFAEYYFTALRDFIKGKPVAPAWEILFAKCRANNLLQTGYMALGVNAHVNHDLAFTLFDVLDDSNAKRDYEKINTVLRQHIMTVFTSLTEESKTIDRTKNKLVFLYRPALYRLIKRWRGNAWRNYLMLQDNTMTKDAVSHRAERMAIFLCRFQKPHLWKFAKKAV